MSMFRLAVLALRDRMLTCGRCRKSKFFDWGFRLCGLCYHAIKDRRGGQLPGRRWRTKLFRNRKREGKV
jgi:hypothetical protein